jgi:predicted alpha/beta hydrolase family esterase
MPQTVLIVHGAGEPRLREGKVYWEPLLGDALGPGYDVHAPRMPEPDDPHHEPWADRIAQLLSEVAAPVLVGHSFGASTLLKFLSRANPLPAFRGLFLIATPFWSSDFPEYALAPEELNRLWSVSPMTFYHSRDDEVVEFSHFRRFQQALPRATFRALDGRGHEFDRADFPELVADVRGLAGSVRTTARPRPSG